MIKQSLRWIVVGLMVGSVVLVALLIQQPDQTSEAIVVFSNYPSPNINLSGSSVPIAFRFDIPTGQDYELNSVQIRTAGGQPGVTLNVSIFQDGGGVPGVLIADLGTQLVTRLAVVDATYNAPPNAVLQNGQRYWVVYQPSDLVGLYMRNVSPAGIFTFVDFQFFNGVNWVGYTAYPITTIDADPIAIVSPPTGGNIIPACNNSDGRLNSICQEPYQTAAIYCRADGAIDVYGITDGAGWLAFRATESEIEAVGVQDENAMIEQSRDGKIRLYRLSTGEFQVNAPMWDVVRGNLPDGYVFQFEGCG